MSHALFGYRRLADAWDGGVAGWCRAASRFVLEHGGQAWFLAAGPGQIGWIKRQLLAAGVPVFGIRFLGSTADLRRALCVRFGLEPPAVGRETLELLLRVRAEARQPGSLLAGLEELDAAGWLDGANSGEATSLLPPTLLAEGFLREIRRGPAWTPGLDRRLRRMAEGGEAPPGSPPLSVLALGWDAGRVRSLDLLAATMRAATGYRAAFLPLPRAEAEALSQSWLEAVAQALGTPDWETCPGAPAEAATGAAPLTELVQRLESADLTPPGSEDTALGTRPDILVGREGGDAVALGRDWVAGWLEKTRREPGARLAVVAPGRTPGAVSLGRALGEAAIVFEDALGERPETGLAHQIARSIVDYHLDETGTEPLLTLIGLLNDHPECLRRPAADFGLPLDPLELRRALAAAFTELQHTNARTLTGGGAFSRHPLAGPVRRLVAHLDRWPAVLGWAECRARWERCLRGFGLDAETVLGAAWTRGADALDAGAPTPERAFFEYLHALLAAGNGAARPMPEGGRKFARVVLTTLPEAAGQTWHSALFLDSNENVWPRPPAENPLLDDRRRAQLNARREELRAEGDRPAPGHLLTTGDRARLEACRFYEVLENCAPDGQLAFSAARHDAKEPGREAHPNEWSLRCAIEAASAPERAADGFLERWRDSARRCPPAAPELSEKERAHLSAVWTRRRDAEAGFDEYHFDFHGLGAAPAAGELAFEPAWAAGRLEAALRSPATFALKQIFGVEGWRRDAGAGAAKTEAWAVGRLAHRWVRIALGGGADPRPLDPGRVRQALAAGLARVRADEETSLGRSLGVVPSAADGGAGGLPPWWRSVLAKTSWVARRCLESLVERVETAPKDAAFFCMGRELTGEINTPAGPLRLSARADILLLDRPELAGAACQFIDLKTGASGGSAAAPTAAKAAAGDGLGLAAGMLLTLAHGADPGRASAGILHPETASWDALPAGSLAGSTADGAALGELARRQRGLLFGQGGGAESAERLPLATTLIPAGTLAAKSAMR